MEKVKGQTIQEAWPTMSLPEKEHIADQVAGCIQQLQQLHSPAMESLNGRPLYSGWLFLDGRDTPHGPLSSDLELQQSLAPALKELPNKVLTRFMTRLPASAPYSFTHGDLNCENIIVKDGNLLGIFDWEYAGYFPAWWEYAATSVGLSEDDGEWKALLRERFRDHIIGKNFCLDFYSLSMYPDLNERGHNILKDLGE